MFDHIWRKAETRVLRNPGYRFALLLCLTDQRTRKGEGCGRSTPREFDDTPGECSERPVGRGNSTGRVVVCTRERKWIEKRRLSEGVRHTQPFSMLGAIARLCRRGGDTPRPSCRQCAATRRCGLTE